MDTIAIETPVVESGLSAKDYADALQVQNACNLSGVVHSFSRVIIKIREQLSIEGNCSNEDIHSHPIVIMYTSKISSLTNYENNNFVSFLAAMEECEKKAQL